MLCSVMRVLILCEFARLHGAERSLLSVLDSVSAAGFQPQIAAPPEGPLATEIEKRGIELLPLRFPHGSYDPSQTARRRAIRALVRESRPDLVHANSLAMSRLAGPLLAEMGIGSLGHVRDIMRLSRQAIADLNCHSRLLAVSEATRDWHVEQGLDPLRTFVLYNGVDLSAFAPRPTTGSLHDELRLSPDSPLVGTVGQIGMRKGTDLFIDTAARIVADVPRAQFVVFGDRTSEKREARELEYRLRQRADRAPLAGRCHFLGYRHQMDRWLNELTVLLHPARQEPLGRVLLEAAASGLAIVASCVGGTPEIFPTAARAASLVPSADLDRLEQATVQLLAQREQRVSLGRAARLRAVTAFDQQQAAAGLIDHYRQVAGRDKRFPPRYAAGGGQPDG